MTLVSVGWRVGLTLGVCVVGVGLGLGKGVGVFGSGVAGHGGLGVTVVGGLHCCSAERILGWFGCCVRKSEL